MSDETADTLEVALKKYIIRSGSMWWSKSAGFRSDPLKATRFGTSREARAEIRRHGWTRVDVHRIARVYLDGVLEVDPPLPADPPQGEEPPTCAHCGAVAFHWEILDGKPGCVHCHKKRLDAATHDRDEWKRRAESAEAALSAERQAQQEADVHPLSWAAAKAKRDELRRDLAAAQARIAELESQTERMSKGDEFQRTRDAAQCRTIAEKTRLAEECERWLAAERAAHAETRAKLENAESMVAGHKSTIRMLESERDAALRDLAAERERSGRMLRILSRLRADGVVAGYKRLREMIDRNVPEALSDPPAAKKEQT